MMNHFINLVVVIGMVLSLGPPLITLQRDDDDDDDGNDDYVCHHRSDSYLYTNHCLDSLKDSIVI